MDNIFHTEIISRLENVNKTKLLKIFNHLDNYYMVIMKYLKK